MKTSAIVCLLIFTCLATAGSASGQQSCDFSIVGTWKPSDQADQHLYRFASDGTVTLLSASTSGQTSDLRELATATYKLDHSSAPKNISFTATSGEGVFTKGTSSMEITGYDDRSFTLVRSGAGPTRLSRVDQNRYFVVLAARLGTFYDKAGPAFPALIKMDGRDTQIDALGVYSVNGRRAFGVVPPEAYVELMKEPHNDSEVMLRLEINPAQYARALKVLRIWERRVREGALLYPKKGSLDNILVAKQVTESLAQCSPEIKMYKLSYVYDEDWLSNKYGAPFIPFHYFKELRRLNESLHVRDDKFRDASAPVASSKDVKATR